MKIPDQAKIFESSFQNLVEAVVKDFRETSLYSEEFLGDLEDGLQKSTYIKNV